MTGLQPMVIIENIPLTIKK